MLSTRKVAAVWLALAFQRVLTAQIPLSSHDFYPQVQNDLRQWDLGEEPAVNATGHFVFETTNSLLQHWANTHYRIGMSENTQCRDLFHLSCRTYNNPWDCSRRYSPLPWSHHRSPFTHRSGLGGCRARSLHDFLPWVSRNRVLASHPCSHSADESALF
jgi:hypothetical protein